MSAKVLRLPSGRQRADLLRRLRPGHAISDDGRDYGPELCSRCLRPLTPSNATWCDDCECTVCLACHGRSPQRSA